MTRTTPQPPTSTLPLLERIASMREHRAATPEECLGQKWNSGEEPYSESLTLAEAPLFPRRLPSFRAVMLAKLRKIVEAFGSQRKAAYELNTRPETLQDWLQLKAVPRDWPAWGKVDSVYEKALEKIRVDEARKNKAGVKK